MHNYKKIVLGGTFDLLHKGHKSLIKKAFLASDFVYIGLTTDKFNQRRDKITLQNQKLRKGLLDNFLINNGYQGRYKIIYIRDIYGIASTDPTIQAILVTKETEENAREINLTRVKIGLTKLRIIKIPFKKDGNGKNISSSNIRDDLYKKVLLEVTNQRLSESIRSKLKKPFGKLIKIDADTRLSANFITVGDIVTKKVAEAGFIPKFSIIDFKTHREQVFNNFGQLGLRRRVADYSVVNNPGKISKSLIFTIEKCLQGKKRGQLIFVKGEEDLAVIPLVLLCPPGTEVLYGQPGKGAVLIKVDQITKYKLYNLLKS